MPNGYATRRAGGNAMRDPRGLEQSTNEHSASALELDVSLGVSGRGPVRRMTPSWAWSPRNASPSTLLRLQKMSAPHAQGSSINEYSATAPDQADKNNIVKKITSLRVFPMVKTTQPLAPPPRLVPTQQNTAEEGDDFSPAILMATFRESRTASNTHLAISHWKCWRTSHY